MKDAKIGRAIVVPILLSLLATSTPGAPQTIAEAAARGGATAKRVLRSLSPHRLAAGVQRQDNGMPPSPGAMAVVTPQQPPSQAQREA
ncbi:MAG TPA: hypothetical protein VLH87_00025, partial [Pyrinomonadaceae bacterium]|nr:hypothetical protein [Pyrinomonadaceae bacterium]